MMDLGNFNETYPISITEKFASEKILVFAICVLSLVSYVCVCVVIYVIRHRRYEPTTQSSRYENQDMYMYVHVQIVESISYLRKCLEYVAAGGNCPGWGDVQVPRDEPTTRPSRYESRDIRAS